jgi:hypothetical protein
MEEGVITTNVCVGMEILLNKFWQKIKTHKWLSILSLSCISVLPLPAINFINFDSLFSSSVTHQNIINETPLDERTVAAKEVLAQFYVKFNMRQYEQARLLLTEQYARQAQNYQIGVMKDWMEVQIKGNMNIENITLSDESDFNTKVFTFSTHYLFKTDNKIHGEKLKAYVVEREGVWTIDQIRNMEIYY